MTHYNIRKTLKLDGTLTKPEVHLDAKSEAALRWSVQFIKKAHNLKQEPSASAIARRALQFYVQYLESLPTALAASSEAQTVARVSNVSKVTQAARDALQARLKALEEGQELPRFMAVLMGQ